MSGGLGGWRGAIVKRPGIEAGSSKEFLLERDAAGFHVERVEIVSGAFSQIAEDGKTRFIAVAEMPEFNRFWKAAEELDGAGPGETRLDQEYS